MRTRQATSLSMLVLFLLAGFTSLATPNDSPSKVDEKLESSVPERLYFSIDENRIFDARGSMEASWEEISFERPEIAESRLGDFSVDGLSLSIELAEWATVPRDDLGLAIVSSDVALDIARANLSDISGLLVREYISPSGYLLQGTELALAQAELLPEVVAIHQVPAAMVVDDSLLFSNETTEVRIEAWRDDANDVISSDFILTDISGKRIGGDIGYSARVLLDDAWWHAEGRWQGMMSIDSLAELSHDPAIAWIRQPPVFGIWNDQSRTHMNANTMSTWFTSDLDGSGQIVGIADTGIDNDHGDFGTRIIQTVDMVGDSSTADTDSGHGTHVACSVLGDGSQGGYAGVVPAAELYFQAMEHDASGSMYSASINTLLNSAYSNGARTHTNSWGSMSSSDYGKYTTDAEDVDDRTNYYDRYYSGRDGLTVLFANGNDGPDSGTVGAPATAKNAISVGMHQARYSGAPNDIMSSSSRGPTDDGRIKPDLLAPGGYVRSCRAQEAQDISGSTWSNQWYMEYTGTSMATPNAAGAAAMVREYLTEIAQRQQPQGALVKSLLILGAEDSGNSRDIPNNDEGWGRVNLRNTLAPNAGRGIWVDDRSVVSSSGSVKAYSFNITSGNVAFKASLVWSDERGSRFANGAQLVNDLNLEVEAPDGTIYRGNDFFNGRSTTGGAWDDLNNVEVVLIDQAQSGIWTVRIKDHSHGGSRSQAYALSVSGVGVNDLRPDASPVQGSISTNIAIPQVGDDVTIFAQIQNFGNVQINNLDVKAIVDATDLATYAIDLGPGESKSLSWPWTPTQAGERTIVIRADPNDLIDEIEENNNHITAIIEVTAPGVKVESAIATVIVEDPTHSVSTWQVDLTNTALLETNASLTTGTVYRQSDGAEFSDWFIGSSGSNFSLEGKGSASINITLVHPSPPDPGTYILPLLGIDVDNGITYPFDLALEVLEIPDLVFNLDTQSIAVSPEQPTPLILEVANQGNSAQGWNLFIQPPSGWQSGFDDLGSRPGAPSGSTGAIAKNDVRKIGITIIPPTAMVAAGSQLQLDILAISQSNNSRIWNISIDLVVETVENASITLESTLGILRPDSSLNLQFTVFNSGNSLLSLYPTAELPGGWSLTAAMQTMQVAPGQSENWLVGIEGNGNAVSGYFELHLTGISNRFTWEGELDVLALAEPTLQFANIEIDGKTWDHPLGPGSHPLGKEFNFTWYVINEGDGNWQPTASISADQGVISDCTDPGLLEADKVIEITCSVLLTSDLMPGSQPKLVLTLNGDGITRESTISMYVEEIRRVVWTDVKTPTLETGEEATVEVQLWNDGNIALSHRLQIGERPDGWSINFDGSNLIQIEPGEAQTIRLRIIANKPGTEMIILGLSDADAVDGNEHAIELISEGEAIIDSTGSGSSVVIWSSLIVIIIGLILIAFIITQRKPTATALTPFLKHTESPAFVPVATPVAAPVAAPADEAFFTNPEPVSAVAVQCWACMENISSEPVLACPDCGARYHSKEHGCGVENLQECRGCQSPISGFVKG